MGVSEASYLFSYEVMKFEVYISHQVHVPFATTFWESVMVSVKMPQIANASFISIVTASRFLFFNLPSGPETRAYFTSPCAFLSSHIKLSSMASDPPKPQ